ALLLELVLDVLGAARLLVGDLVGSDVLAHGFPPLPRAGPINRSHRRPCRRRRRPSGSRTRLRTGPPHPTRSRVRSSSSGRRRSPPRLGAGQDSVLAAAAASALAFLAAALVARRSALAALASATLTLLTGNRSLSRTDLPDRPRR